MSKERIVSVEVRAVTNEGNAVAYDHRTTTAGYHTTGIKHALQDCADNVLKDATEQGLL
jgi:hypothetical protein